MVGIMLLNCASAPVCMYTCKYIYISRSIITHIYVCVCRSVGHSMSGFMVRVVRNNQLVTSDFLHFGHKVSITAGGKRRKRPLKGALRCPCFLNSWSPLLGTTQLKIVRVDMKIAWYDSHINSAMAGVSDSLSVILCYEILWRVAKPILSPRELQSP